MSERRFEISVLGATGFTGRLTAEYLAGAASGLQRRGGAPLRWAIAGRNPKRLAAVQRTCEALGSKPEVVLCSVDEPQSLQELARQSGVIATTVGPFIRYGFPVAQACAEEGAHYLDITGEPDFVKRLMRELDQPARERGVKLVSCCGFDSIPHDFGAWYCVRQLTADAPIRMYAVVEGNGEFSGGTWHSAVGAMSDLGKRRGGKSAKSRTDNPTGRRVGKLPSVPRYDSVTRGWIAPLPTIDPTIVLRTAASMNAFGPDFRYGHFMRVGSSGKLLLGGVGVGAALALSKVSVTRDLLLNFKRPGEGPSRERRARSWFRVTFVAESEGGARALSEVSGGDPGYDETSKMLGESALCLARDAEALAAWDSQFAVGPSASTPSRSNNAGVRTPVQALGAPLLERLQRAGMCFRQLD
ncbi:MAG: saccharopine dehydrogenase NADP-binding domain-containing protein [Polyangiaceae bacterium]|nr:saccharopine dehydrogenase NADP-binding domain-containing protein [Myxococcales bacterium]MCB9587975.1 saccharopine dehydrogenase NADP-binding domain-containing protein [Polyangiaceae bacterium]